MNRLSQFESAFSKAVASALYSLLMLAFVLYPARLSFGQTRSVVGYYYFWDKTNFPYSKIEYDNLNCIAHAFIVPNADGSISPESGATWQQYLYPEMVNAAHQNNVKVVVSVGGWGNSAGFSPMSASAAARANFAGQMKNFCLQNDYDGVDIDWEYPASGDRANFVAMLRTLRDSLSSSGRTLTLSIAAPGYIASGYDYANLISSLDWVGVMTYDYYGSWTANSGFVSPLYSDPSNNQGSVNSSMTQFIQSGAVPLPKLFMGLAFYGYNFQSSGLYQPRTGSAPSVTYSAAVDSENSGWTYHWDDVSKCPYLTNSSNTHVIAFDDTVSIADKCNYLLSKNLGGLIIWRLGLDNLGSSQPLLETTWKSLNTPTGIVYHHAAQEPVRGFGLQNYPNPFNPTTVVSYKLSALSHVTLKVYDMLGREVETLVNEVQKTGSYEVVFDASKLASGAYLSVLSVDGRMSNRKMLYLK